MGKLLSGKRDQGDRDCVHGRDLIAGSNTLRECFNNVDVSVPLWWSSLVKSGIKVTVIVFMEET